MIKQAPQMSDNQLLNSENETEVIYMYHHLKDDNGNVLADVGSMVALWAREVGLSGGIWQGVAQQSAH